MERIEAEAPLISPAHDAEVEYLFDMVAELAKLARRLGEPETAIFLEAILAAKAAGEVAERA